MSEATPPSDDRLSTVDEKRDSSLNQAQPQLDSATVEQGSLSSAKDGETASSSSDTDYPKAARLAVIVFAVTLCVFLVALDLTIVGTAIPRITDEFHSLDQVGWYGSAFFLTVAAFQPTWGKALKYFDLKLAYLLSIFIFELGSLICGVSNSSTTLIAGRAVAGIGGAGLAAGGYTIIAFSAPIRLRPALIGIVGVAFCISSVIGPLLGGVFTEHLSWRWCFYINLPIGGVALGTIIVAFRTPKAARPLQAPFKEKTLQMDLFGTFTIIGAIVCYLLAFQWGGTLKSWRSSDVIGTLVGFGLLSIVFVVIEYISGERALLIGRLLKDRTILAMCVFILFASGAFFVLLYYLPIYFQTTRGASAQQSGIDIIPLVLAAGLFSLVAGGLMTTLGHIIPIMLVGSVFAAVASGLIYTFEIDTPSSKWIGYQILLGIGIGSVFQIPATAAQSVVNPEDLSSVSSMVLFFQMIGGSIWVSAAQAGFANKLVSSLPSVAPNVDPARVLATGATELRNVFTSEEVAGILIAYIDGLRVPFAIVIACASVTCLLSLTPRWEKINIRI